MIVSWRTDCKYTVWGVGARNRVRSQVEMVDNSPEVMCDIYLAILYVYLQLEQIAMLATLTELRVVYILFFSSIICDIITQNRPKVSLTVTTTTASCLQLRELNYRIIELAPVHSIHTQNINTAWLSTITNSPAAADFHITKKNKTISNV